MDKDSHLRRLGEEFQLRWKSERPDLKEFLSRVDDSQKGALAAILIPIDFVQSLMRGTPPLASHYEQFGAGFGNLAKDLLQDMTLAWSSSESSLIVDPTVDMPIVDIEKTKDFLGETTVGTDQRMRSSDGTEIPRQIGSYKLLRELGEGGMGSVWIAQQSEPVKRQVALKLIKTGREKFWLDLMPSVRRLP